jgi:outer membrane protein
VTLTQALLRGARVESNLARLRQAELDTLASEYELRGLCRGLVADVEQAYWDYALASRRTEIFAEALAVAEQQLDRRRAAVSPSGNARDRRDRRPRRGGPASPGP